MIIKETVEDFAEALKQATLNVLGHGYTLTSSETQESLGKLNEEKDEESIPAYPWEDLNIAYPEDYIEGAIESVCKGICDDFYVNQNSKRAEMVFLLALSYSIVKTPDSDKTRFDMLSAVTSFLESSRKENLE